MEFINYTKALSSCLMTYQYIEELLKQCLFRTHAIIRMRVDGLIPYKLPFDSIDNSALGRLIDHYKLYSDDAGLIDQLRQLKNHRDHCAHRGYILSDDEQKDSVFLKEKEQEILEFDRKAQECFLLLGKEMERLEKLANDVHKLSSIRS